MMLQKFDSVEDWFELLKRRVGLMCLLFNMKILLFIFQAAFAQYQQSCPRNTDRYCQGGNFFNEYSYEWFEGSDPKSMFGVVFKETVSSTQTTMFNKATAVSGAGLVDNNRLLFKYNLFAYDAPMPVAGTSSGATYMFDVNSSGTKSVGVTRIRRIWQFPNPKSSYDETAGGTLPATQIWWQVLYSWTEPGPSSTPAYPLNDARNTALGSYNQDWFMGDVVPFPACFYIVRMVTTGTGALFTKFYTVEQMLFSVQFDTANQSRHAMVYSNFKSTAVVGPRVTNGGTASDNDLPQYGNEEISYYPGWCAFYWLTRSNLILKVDNTCQSSWATDPNKDPCGTSTYLFPTPNAMTHYGYGVPGATANADATFIDQVFVYGFMYFAIVGNTNQVYKARRTNLVNGNIIIENHWNLVTLSNLKVLTPVMYPIFKMNSLDGYGYYITMSNTYNADTIWQYVIYLKLDAFGAKAIDATTGNYIEMNDNNPATLQQPQLLNPLKIDNTSKFNQRLYQTKGDMVDSRPLYEAWGGGGATAAGANYVANRNKLNLITSVNNLYMTVNEAPASGPRSMDFYNYDLVVNANQMFLLMPGTLTDDIGNKNTINWNKLKVAIYDVVTKDEVERWPMHTCGDGIQNSTAFEVCDYAQALMDPAATGYIYPNTALYPDYKNKNPAFSGRYDLTTRGVWYWPKTTSLGFPTGTGYPTRLGDDNYHLCNTNCQDLPVEMCGDGVQSNGLNNADGREVCDDGNVVSGDGCSSDCKTIEVGWECPSWGKPCRLLCGNGVLDPPYLRYNNGINGATTLFTEECDLGDSGDNSVQAAGVNADGQSQYTPKWSKNHGKNFNFGSFATNEDAFDAPLAYQNACSSTCKISSRYYWACNTNTATAAVPGTAAADAKTSIARFAGGTAAVTPTSQCAYLCGNKWLDNIGQTDASHTTSHALTEECDLLVQSYSGQTSLGYTYNANLANVNLQTTPVPSTTTPQAWLAPSMFTAGTNPNWIWPFITPNVGNTLQQTGYTDPFCEYDQRNIGCTELCKKRTAAFICPDSNLYDVGAQTIKATNNNLNNAKPAINWTGPQLLCSDRIQDGVFDGPYPEILRALQTPSVKIDSYQWNSYILYSTYRTTDKNWRNTWDQLDTNDRIWSEQCDNNKDYTHGCDKFGRITPGWTCKHYYVAIRQTPMVAEVEVPWFRSVCKLTGTSPPVWRLLFGDDHSGFTSEGWISHDDAVMLNYQDDDDEWGDDEEEGVIDSSKQLRGMNHDPVKAFEANLPTCANTFRNHALSQNAKGGVNGQIRLAESPDSPNAQAIVLAYPLTSTNPDNVFIYYKTTTCTAQVLTVLAPNYPGIPTSACGTITPVQNALVAGTLKNKQRNTFGPYIVSNSGLQTLLWQGFQTAAAFTPNIYTSAAVANIEFLGNYEQYYWGYLGLMFVRLSDGATFQIFIMNSNFDTIAAGGNTVPESVDSIQQTDMKLQFVIPGKVIVPPVFVNDVAVFYYKEAAGQGYLLFYKWSTFVDGLVLQTKVATVSDTSTTPVYQKYSLVRTATGVIFKVAGATVGSFYKTSDYSWTRTNVIFSSGTATVGTVLNTAQQLLQPRDNPKTFAATTIPQIFGYQNNNYMYLMTWVESTFTLTVTTSIVLPCSAGLTVNTGGYLCYDQMLKLSPEWIDVGYQSFVILSSINCGALKGKTAITGMSARFYLLSTVPDIDANNDGIVDGTQTSTLGVLDVGSGTRVNFFKGWTCWDLPNTSSGTSATTFSTTTTWTYPYV